VAKRHNPATIERIEASLAAIAAQIAIGPDIAARHPGVSALGIMALKDHIARTGLSQTEATKLLGVTQPRISDLVRGKIELFGLDTLVNMIGAAGLHVELRISDAA
jgi:predicted XRE-type DNA-binding protein